MTALNPRSRQARRRRAPIDGRPWPSSSWGLASALAGAWLAASLVACQGCHAVPGGASPAGQTAPATPTVRLYFVSDLAGALEPCGCTKDQLGGLDHAAAWIANARAEAPESALVVAGPTFFMNEVLEADHKDQDLLKAETLAQGLKSI